MIQRVVRVVVGLVGVAAGIAAVALYLRWPIARDYLPWSGYYAEASPLSYYLLSALAAAYSAPLLWIALSGDLHKAVPGPIALAAGLIGVAMYVVQGYATNPDNPPAMNAAIVLAGVAVAAAAVYALARGIPDSPARPKPPMLRFALLAIAAGLAVAGGAMVLRVPNILPWDVAADAAALYGRVFLGGSMYFLFAAVAPGWEVAAGQLMGLLAYDLVLILPFLRHFADVKPEHVPGLIVYTIVAVSTGVLSAAYLFVHRDTRYFGAAMSAASLPRRGPGGDWGR